MNNIDSKIINEIIQGNDHKVIDGLYDDVFPNVKNYIIKNSGSVAEAEDCFQEGITRFYRQVLNNEFDSRYKVHGYIYTVSIRLFINLVKREKRNVSLDTLNENIMKVNLKEDSYSEIENHSTVQDILGRLGEKCKNLLYHTIFSDLVNEDLMHRFQYSSIAAVKMQHKRCKQKLIELFKEEPQLKEVLRA